MHSAVLHGETISEGGVAMIDDFDMQSYAYGQLTGHAKAGYADGGARR